MKANNNSKELHFFSMNIGKNYYSTPLMEMGEVDCCGNLAQPRVRQQGRTDWRQTVSKETCASALNDTNTSLVCAVGMSLYHARKVQAEIGVLWEFWTSYIEGVESVCAVGAVLEQVFLGLGEFLPHPCPCGSRFCHGWPLRSARRGLGLRCSADWETAWVCGDRQRLHWFQGTSRGTSSGCRYIHLAPASPRCGL